jgi:GYF domain 2
VIRFACHSCGFHLSAPESCAGRPSKCRQCGSAVSVPTPGQLVAFPPAEATTKIHLYFGSRRQGPYVLSQIQSMWVSGAITADATYWYEGLTEWKEMTELFEMSKQRQDQKKRKDEERVRYNEKNDTFVGPLPAIMRLAIKAIQQLGYRIDNANESLGILTFQTSLTMGSWQGALCSLGFEETRENTYRVNVSGKSAGVLAFDAFSEAKGRAQKVVDLMADLAD